MKKPQQLFLLFRIHESEADRANFSVCLGAFRHIESAKKVAEKDRTKTREAACKLLGVTLKYDLKAVEVRG